HGGDGYGFFVTQTAEGEEALTRDGSLTTDDLGFLITSGGDYLLGDGGPIQLPAGEVSIGEDGSIQVNNEQVATLRVATVADPSQLEKAGGGRFHIPDGVTLQGAVGYVIRQGYLESANVDVITQMVEMIASYRSYEADAKALKGQDESLEKLINDVGRPI
ncbi:MAG TPA: flagellar basal body rod C-terminal domain-containing protein, partial [candidate division Zixibacteria bacterium]|nr:flagellar basal body rod C-terminal domain-containing protein [candidate division Zixibacteria bacterium]